MPKYDFIYTVCDGAFMLDIRTGYYIIAENKEEAMQAAKRLDEILSESFDLQCCFNTMPEPHFTVHGIDSKHHRGTQPQIINYLVQKSSDSSKSFMGDPIFLDDSFQSVSEADFINKLSKEHSFDMGMKQEIQVRFECISYGVIPQESK
jgi:hypothetical protein